MLILWEQLEQEGDSGRFTWAGMHSAHFLLKMDSLHFSELIEITQHQQQMMSFPLRNTLQPDAWKMLPVYTIQTWFGTLFILSSAEPPNMNSVFIVQSVPVVFSRASVSWWALLWNGWLWLAVLSLLGEIGRKSVYSIYLLNELVLMLHLLMLVRLCPLLLAPVTSRLPRAPGVTAAQCSAFYPLSAYGCF